LDYGDAAFDALKKSMFIHTESLMAESSYFLQAVKDDGNSMPEWCNYKEESND
jgi:hypothetical protein